MYGTSVLYEKLSLVNHNGIYRNMMEIQYFSSKKMKTTTKNYGGGSSHNVLYQIPNLTESKYHLYIFI